jgi:glyoxylate/hydroxypyruvate reductase A
MNPTVPFIHNLNSKDASTWLVALQSAIPFANICQVTDLFENELEKIEVAIVANPNPTDLLTLPNLKWIQSLWAGVEQLLDKSINDKISIVRLIDSELTETMAEAVLAWTLYLHRNMPQYTKQQVKKEWVRHDVLMASEQTIGILGMGHLGLRAAQRLHDNGFNVLGWNRGKNLLDLGIETLSGYEGLSKIAACSDVIVILLPLSPLTHGLLNQHFFNDLKHGASLINFARAAIVDEQALVKALDTRQLKHAVLDVFLSEPLPKNDSLWANPHVTILPHISAPTNKQTASQVVAKNLKAYFDSNEIPKRVSREKGY